MENICFCNKNQELGRMLIGVGFVFHLFGFFVFNFSSQGLSVSFCLSWNLLHRLGWPQTQRPTCFCLSSARIKGLWHHSLVMIFKQFWKRSRPWQYQCRMSRTWTAPVNMWVQSRQHPQNYAELGLLTGRLWEASAMPTRQGGPLSAQVLLSTGRSVCLHVLSYGFSWSTFLNCFRVRRIVGFSDLQDTCDSDCNSECYYSE